MTAILLIRWERAPFQFLFPLVLHTHTGLVLNQLKSGFELLNTTFFCYRKTESIQMCPVNGGGKRDGSCKV